MKKLALAVVVIGLLAIATGQALAEVDIKYEALRGVRKIYNGTTHIDWEFDGKLLMTGVTVAEREKMGLPLTKPNSLFDSKLPEDSETNPATVPCTDEDGVYTFEWTDTLGIPYKEDDIWNMVREKLKNKRLEYIRKLEQIPPETIIFEDFMKETFTTEETLKAK